ncbi:adenosine receptor A2a-like [Anneissia japonica]|uniref:adenosine receptor A2a-like n=1 Tax=Anneissia japonica TaxID=1529436 RepID=UPI00142572F6|nr:adenosine receptor A2a-like [Anneissia japonica]
MDAANKSGKQDEIGLSVVLIAYVFSINISLMLLILSANFIVLFTIHRNSSLFKKPIHIFAASLALVDFMNGLVGVPFAIAGYVLHAVQNQCSVWYFSPIIIIISMSVVNLMTMTADRWIAVRFPFRYRIWMTAGRAVKICTFANMFGFVIGSMPYSATLVASFVVELNETSVDNCDRLFSLYRLYGDFVFAYVNVTLTALCIPIMLIAYGYIFIKARNHMKQREMRRGKHISTLAMKACKTCAEILIVFILCLAPSTIKEPVENAIDDGASWLVWFPWFSDALIISNSFMNPLIYSQNNDDFKKQYKKSIDFIISKFRPKVRIKENDKDIQLLSVSSRTPVTN